MMGRVSQFAFLNDLSRFDIMSDAADFAFILFIENQECFSTHIDLPLMTLTKLNSEGLALVGHYIKSS